MNKTFIFNTLIFNTFILLYVSASLRNSLRVVTVRDKVLSLS